MPPRRPTPAVGKVSSKSRTENFGHDHRHDIGFFSRIYEVVRAVPRGKVATYGQIAALIGQPRAARTVGWALNALPVKSDVPWHRVINAQGRISTAGRDQAASLQAALLRREGVRVDRDGGVPLERHRWRPTGRRGFT
jgi:methylated-DNA-protein-cysteine methyltransferase-like protein